MRKSLSATALLVVAGLLLLSGAGAAAASATGAVDCVGLACPASAGGMPGYAQGQWSATTVLGPRALATQGSAGFYEFGHGTTLDRTAVAYVIPQGRLGDAPDAIRQLPVVRGLAPSDPLTGTVVVLGAEAALWVPGETVASAARVRPRAHAATADQFGCEDAYFCIYSNASFTGTRLQFHDINSNSIWTQLTDWGFNDVASSIRNRRDRDSWLAENLSGGGERHCYDSHSSASSLGTFNDKASSTYNSPGDGSC